MSTRRIICAARFCAYALLASAAHAADAKVTDVSGHEYELKTVRLTKNKSLDMDCGGTIVKHPFASVKTMRLYPSKIKSIGGKLYFGIEATLLDSLEVGVGVPCFVPADNAVSGKSSKGSVTVPFEKLRGVYVLGKEDKEVSAKADETVKADETGDAK